MKRTGKKVLLWASVLLLVLAAVCAVYVSDYYRADLQAVAAFAPQEGVTVETLSDGTIVCGAEDAKAGLIFYPGGKVEHTAYAPLMEACAAEGLLCVLVEMPFRLAVLDVNAADGIRERFSEVERWYIGGHSLGGSMAASYLSGHTDAFDGLILLGSYSASDLSAAEIEVLSVYGSEDRVLNREKYEENRENLPQDYTELVIEGGCHAWFGTYGAQEGDGVPAISCEEQIRLTAEAVGAFCRE